MEQTRQLAALVVTHNRLEKLRATVERLLQSPRTVLEWLVVVDNASTDGTGDWLASIDDARLHVMRMDENLGGAGGFEAGMRRAAKDFDPDWIVLMDDDGRPVTGALDVFQRADLAGWDAVSAAVYHPDGRICDMNRPSRNPFWHPAVLRNTIVAVLSAGVLGSSRDAFHLMPEDYATSAPPQPVDGASFVGLFLSRDALRKAGFPNGELFIYGDDVLYSLGLRAAGGRIAFWPAIRFEHDFSTINAAERRFRPLWKCYYHHRNLMFVYRKAAGRWFWPALVLILPKWVLKVRHYDGERRVFMRLIAMAISDGLRAETQVDHDYILTVAKGRRVPGTR